MYRAELWPEGVFIQSYYELRRAAVVGSNIAVTMEDSGVFLLGLHAVTEYVK